MMRAASLGNAPGIVWKADGAHPRWHGECFLCRFGQRCLPATMEAASMLSRGSAPAARTEGRADTTKQTGHRPSRAPSPPHGGERTSASISTAGRPIVRRLPVGAELQPDGGVHFRIWAPRRRQVEIVLERGSRADAIPLAPEGQGYASAFVPDVGAGACYRLRLDG